MEISHTKTPTIKSYQVHHCCDSHTYLYKHIRATEWLEHSFASQQIQWHSFILVRIYTLTRHFNRSYIDTSCDHKIGASNRQDATENISGIIEKTSLVSHALRGQSDWIMPNKSLSTRKTSSTISPNYGDKMLTTTRQTMWLFHSHNCGKWRACCSLWYTQWTSVFLFLLQSHMLRIVHINEMRQKNIWIGIVMLGLSEKIFPSFVCIKDCSRASLWVYKWKLA